MIPLHSLFEFDTDDVGGVVKKIIPGTKSWLKGDDVQKPGFVKRWFGGERNKVKNIATGRQEGFKASRNKGFESGKHKGYASGIKQGFKSGQYYGAKDTMNRVNTDDKLRGQITREHIGKQVGDAANKASQFATKNAGTIGLVGAGAAGAGLLNRRKRQ